MKITLTRSHAVLFISGFALALLLSAAPVRRIFGTGVPNTFAAGEVASSIAVEVLHRILVGEVEDPDQTRLVRPGVVS